MTPDLLEQGARRVEARKAALAANRGQTESGGRAAGFSRVAVAGEVDVTHGRILYLEDVHVSFDGFKAINGLSLDIAPGELRCIIGPNGAGKTTLFKMLVGQETPDKGELKLGETVKIIVQALLLALVVRTFLFQPFNIPSGSMKSMPLFDVALPPPSR